MKSKGEKPKTTSERSSAKLKNTSISQLYTYLVWKRNSYENLVVHRPQVSATATAVTTKISKYTRNIRIPLSERYPELGLLLIFGTQHFHAHAMEEKSCFLQIHAVENLFAEIPNSVNLHEHLIEWKWVLKQPLVEKCLVFHNRQTSGKMIAHFRRKTYSAVRKINKDTQMETIWNYRI